MVWFTKLGQLSQICSFFLLLTFFFFGGGGGFPKRKAPNTNLKRRDSQRTWEAFDPYLRIRLCPLLTHFTVQWFIPGVEAVVVVVIVVVVDDVVDVEVVAVGVMPMVVPGVLGGISYHFFTSRS